MAKKELGPAMAELVAAVAYAVGDRIDGKVKVVPRAFWSSLWTA